MKSWKMDTPHDMDNATRKYNKLFTETEQKTIKGILTECKDKLISNYYAMLKGAMPEVITVYYEENTYQFGAAIQNE